MPWRARVLLNSCAPAMNTSPMKCNCWVETPLPWLKLWLSSLWSPLFPLCLCCLEWKHQIAYFVPSGRVWYSNLAAYRKKTQLRLSADHVGLMLFRKKCLFGPPRDCIHQVLISKGCYDGTVLLLMMYHAKWLSKKGILLPKVNVLLLWWLFFRFFLHLQLGFRLRHSRHRRHWCILAKKTTFGFG